MQHFRALTREDIIEGTELGENYEGKTLVMYLSGLSEQYKHGEFQLWRATGGFGCDPTALGSAVFAECLADGEHSRHSRGNFMGVVKPEVIEEFNAWKKEHEEAKEEGKHHFYDELDKLGTGDEIEAALKLVGKVFDHDVRYMKKYVPEATNAITETQIGKERINFLLDTIDFAQLNKKAGE